MVSGKVYVGPRVLPRVSMIGEDAFSTVVVWNNSFLTVSSMRLAKCTSQCAQAL